MLQQTPLIECHRQDGAKLVDFSGWEMPIHYGSQVEEHHQVRNHAGLFDVSHMTLVDVSGPDQAAYLKRLLANDIDRLDEGRALYTAMLNAEGGIIDDLIVYRREKDYRLVVNCATKEKMWRGCVSMLKRLTSRSRHRAITPLSPCKGRKAERC